MDLIATRTVAVMWALAQGDVTGLSSPLARIIIIVGLLATLVVLLRWWWQQRKR